MRRRHKKYETRESVQMLIHLVDDNDIMLKDSTCTHNATSKADKGDTSTPNALSSLGATLEKGESPDEKKLRRIMANRRSAKASRERRSQLFTELQSTIDNLLLPTNRVLNEENRRLKAQVEEIRHQLLMTMKPQGMMIPSFNSAVMGQSNLPVTLSSGRAGTLLPSQHQTPIDAHTVMQQTRQMHQQLLQLQSVTAAHALRPSSSGNTVGGMADAESSLLFASNMPTSGHRNHFPHSEPVNLTNVSDQDQQELLVDARSRQSGQTPFFF